MEVLFLNILNMSITASYVILAMLAVRLLLKGAPKKYTYMLWSVPVFRLVCPFSFSSVISIFNLKPFDMTAAQSESAAALTYIPADMGTMNSPSMTVGIPAMNSMIRSSLPEATPFASVNPLQIWIALGTVIWCAGIFVLLLFGIVMVIRLNRRMSTAVLLENNIYESDKTVSPFVLGLVHPKIYIPFGISEPEKSYILRHETFHVERKDHLVKLLAFVILTVHWFNPLAWIAFALMSRDMEMSCDERVLLENDTALAGAYSTTLLSFAANRRFPIAGPLAFGESGVKGRIKNVLKFKKPGIPITIAAILLSLAAAAACTANPITDTKPKLQDTASLFGSYEFQEQIYMNPLSSFLALGDFKEYYTFTEKTLTVTSSDGQQKEIIPITFEWAEVDEEEFNACFMFDRTAFDISEYDERFQVNLTESDRSRQRYRIYLMDDEIWLARVPHLPKSDGVPMFWSIYRITPFNGELSSQVSKEMADFSPRSITGTKDGVDAFLSVQGDFKSGYEKDTCYNITTEEVIANSDYSVFKYDTSCASFLLYDGEVYALGEWFGGFGLTSMAPADLNNDGFDELYYTYSWGSGLHRSHAAYFDSATKKSTVFDYEHLNEDMILVRNGAGLSLYSAHPDGIESFVAFTLKADGFIGSIEYENDQIGLKTDFE